MKATINAKDFNRLIAATKGFVELNNKHPLLSFIRLEFSASSSQVTAVALDGYKMSVETAVLSSCDKDFTAYVRSNVKLPSKENMYAQVELIDDELIVRCDDFIFGYLQPDTEKWVDWKNLIPKEDVQYKITFNGNLLLSALQAAKVSCGNSFSKPITLEFRDPIKPIVLRTNKEDIKMILPMRVYREG